jgi:hypothetical protein
MSSLWSPLLGALEMNMRIWAAIHDRWILFVQRVVVGTRLVFKVHWEFRAGFRFAITCVCAFERYMNRLEVPRSPAVLFIWPIYFLLVECLIFIASNPDSCALNFLNLRWNPQFRGLRVSVGHFFCWVLPGFQTGYPENYHCAWLHGALFWDPVWNHE